MGKIFRLVYGAHRGTVGKPGLLEAIDQANRYADTDTVKRAVGTTPVSYTHLN